MSFFIFLGFVICWIASASLFCFGLLFNWASYVVDKETDALFWLLTLLGGISMYFCYTYSPYSISLIVK